MTAQGPPVGTHVCVLASIDTSVSSKRSMVPAFAWQALALHSVLGRPEAFDSFKPQRMFVCLTEEDVILRDFLTPPSFAVLTLQRYFSASFERRFAFLFMVLFALSSQSGP
jgi:hypothetical protein